MTTLLEFISGLLDGVGLVMLAVTVGGVGYTLFVLGVTRDLSPIRKLAADQVLRMTCASAGTVALVRLVQLTLKPWALAGAIGRWDLQAFAKTQVFQSGIVSVVLALCLGAAVFWVRRGIERGCRWSVVLILTVLFMGNEAWLSHAASRVEGGESLMAVTVLHMLGAVVWAGGITHLFLFWRMTRHHPEARSVWPELVARFSPVGILSVALIVGPGLYLAWSYVGDWSGLIGTGYGNMLIAKIAFFVLVLALATLNLRAARVWRRTGDARTLNQAVPIYIEVELALATALLFTATALTSFPPAVDVPEDMATAAEIWMMFSPKLPRLNGPEIILIEAPELTDLTTGEIGQKEDLSWDRFNHNISGVILLAMAAVALLDLLGGVPWARHWPLIFIGFSVLIVVFANPDHWPLGKAGFVESVQETEVVQHWLAGLVIFGLGFFEWRARHVSFGAVNLRFVFPGLCILGGIILLTHSHAIYELKREFLVQSTHVSMGVLGVVVGCGRWLELRMPPPYNRVAGFISVAAMMLVGLILLFYTNPDLLEL